MMRDVAVVSTAQTPHARRVEDRNEVEMLMPVLEAVKGAIGVTQEDLDFTCSGSTDYLAGQGFSFVTILDGVGPYPPIVESHVEMDGAWALYEAWVKIQTGAADTALVYAYGKSSPGDLPRVLSRQLDPYYTGPVVAGLDQPGRAAGPGAAGRRQGHRGRLRRRRRPVPGVGAGQSERHDQPRHHRRADPGRAVPGVAAAQGRLPRRSATGRRR